MPGDLTGDNQITLADWFVLQSNLLADTSHLSLSDAYALGDIDNSGRVGPEDFREFKRSWELLYGTAALGQLTTAVPEPLSGTVAMLLATTASICGLRPVLLQRMTQ